MPRATFLQSNFNGGEWTPLAAGRADLAKYKNSLALCRNYLPMQQGGLTRRPGTQFVATTKVNTGSARLEAFVFSNSQAYVLEFGDQYIRFYTNAGQVQTGIVSAYNNATAYNPGDLAASGGVSYVCIAATTGNAPPNATYWYALTGSILEIPTPYSLSDVWKLSFAQLSDVLYLADGTHPVQKLERLGSVNWACLPLSPIDGPYDGINTTSTTLTPSGSSGTIQVQASSTTGINNGAGFTASDIGRAIRLRYSSNAVSGIFTDVAPSDIAGVGKLLSVASSPIYTWVWGTITAVTSTTQITVTLQDIFGSTAPEQATATAVVSGGVVIDVQLSDQGMGYKDQLPAVLVVPHNAGAAVITASVSAFGFISSLTLVSGGSGYAVSSSIPLTFSGRGSGASGYAVTDAGGVVISLHLTNGGFGYAGGATVTAGGAAGAGSGATAKATVGDDGSIISIEVTAGGTGYTGGADVYIDPPYARVSKPTRYWYLDLWNSANGYPSAVGFHQSRLLLGGCPSFPNRVDASNVGDYENFGPTEYDGTVTDSNAFAFSLNSGKQDQAQWFLTDENGLLVGTAGGEWIIAPSSVQQALTPTNVNTKIFSNHGSAAVPPMRLGKSTLFIQKDKRKLMELFFQFMYNTFVPTDLSLVGEHLTKTGIKQMTHTLSPQQVIWMARNDGFLSALTYDKEQEVLGWHGHQLGGYSDAARTLPPVVESVCVIPEASGLRDQIWLLVQRTVNGQVFRSIETLSKLWEDGDTPATSTYFDCSASVTRAGNYSYTSGFTLTLNFVDAFGNSCPHGLNTGDSLNLTLAGDLASYSGAYTVSYVSPSSLHVTLATAPGGTHSGNFTGTSTTVRGFTWLEGETVSVLGDGATIEDQVVDNTGAVTLPVPASTVVIGLRYTAQGKLQKIEAGGADGPAQGKLQRIHRVTFRFFQSSMPELGSDDPSTGGFSPEPWRSDTSTLGSAPALVTGDMRWSYEGDWQPGAQVAWQTSDGFPSNILMISAQLDTEDAL